MADGEVLIDIKGDDSKFQKTLSSLGSVAKQALGTALGNLGAQALSSLTSAASNAINTLKSDVLSVGQTFEASMSNVGALMGIDKASDDFARLKQAAADAGATTQFSASEAADALGYMALAGWDASQATGALDGVLNLAAASGMDLAAASDMVTDYLSAFSMEAEDAAYFSDILAYAQANSSTSAEALGQAYKNCAANMNAAGQDIETTTSLLAMMANQGLKGSEAGTALTAIMRDMTAKMEDGCIAIGDTSVAVMDAEGNYRDLTDILLDVEAATDGMGDAERAMALSSTFTADSIKGMNLMLNAGVDAAQQFEEELRNSSGAAIEMAERMNDNLQGDMKIMRSEYEALCNAIYEGANGPLRDLAAVVNKSVLPALLDLVNGVEGADKEVTDAIQELATTAVQILGNMAPRILQVVSALITSVVSALVQAAPTILSGLVSLTSDVIAAFVVALPGLVQAIADTLNTTVDTILFELIPVIIGALPEILAAFVDGLTSIIQHLAELAPALMEQTLPLIVNGIVALTSAFLEALPAFILALSNLIAAVVAELPKYHGALLSGAIQLFLALVESLPQILPALIEAVIQVIMAVISVIPQYIPLLLDVAVQLFMALVQAAPMILQALLASLGSLIQSAVSYIPTFITSVITAAIQLFGGIVTAVPQILTSLIGAIGSLLNNIPGTIMGYAGSISDAAFNMMMGMINGISGAAGAVWDTITNVCWGALDAVKSFFGIASPSKVMRKMGIYIDKGLGGGIEEDESDVVRAMRGVMDSTLDVANMGIKAHATADAAFSMANGYGNSVVMQSAAENSALMGKIDALLAAYGSGKPTIVIQEMYVREEEDIERISERLSQLVDHRLVNLQ